ncbi:MAG: hypothetical protein ACUVRK_08545 [Spirochaetota bacterium]
MHTFTKNTRIVSAILLLVIVCGFVACKSEPVDDAALVALRYLTTTDERQLFSFLNRTSKRRIENMKKNYESIYPFIWVHHDTDATWDIVKIEKTENEATVTVQCIKHKKQNAIGLVVMHKLVREDGKWKIDISDQLPSL